MLKLLDFSTSFGLSPHSLFIKLTHEAATDLVGDFDLAEDALQEAFSAALHQWPIEGVKRS